MKKIVIVFFIVLTLLSQICLGQEMKASVKLDTNAMLIGDQVKMHLAITVPAKSAVIWPVIGDTIMGHIRILNRTKTDTVYSPDKKITSLNRSYLLTTFDSGYYSFPPVRFYVQNLPDTTKIPMQTEGFFLNVHTIRVDTTQAFKPIKGPIKVPISFRELLPYILAGIIAILIIWFIVFYIKKRRKSEPIFQIRPKIRLLPHEVALAELEKLRIKKLWQAGKIKDYYTELTEIIRIYIHDRFEIMAMEMTSDEILDLINQHHEIQKSSKGKLNQMFILADLVKFAKALPLPSEHEGSLDDAVAFVHETIMQPLLQPELAEKPEQVTEKI
ncbi:MAG: hypothetical protein NTX61_06660 [Bacteroidetes bacterium]|nr:hypothetical protein [Bacteroidota bacterium]